MQPADARRLLADEAIAAQGKRGRVILAALECLRIEGIGGGDDQFFLVTSSGIISRLAKAASTGLCAEGSAT